MLCVGLFADNHVCALTTPTPFPPSLVLRKDDDDPEQYLLFAGAGRREDEGVNRLDGVGFCLYRRAVGTLSVYHDCLRTVAGPIVASATVPVDGAGLQLGEDDICDYTSDMLKIIAEAFGKNDKAIHEDFNRFSSDAAIFTGTAQPPKHKRGSAKRELTGLALRQNALILIFSLSCFHQHPSTI